MPYSPHSNGTKYACCGYNTNCSNVTQKQTAPTRQQNKPCANNTWRQHLRCALPTDTLPTSSYYRHKSTNTNDMHHYCSDRNKSGYSVKETHAYNALLALYNAETRPLHQPMYFQRKRPQEDWNPTLWRIPLQPLPKRHKAHSIPPSGKSNYTNALSGKKKDGSRWSPLSLSSAPNSLMFTAFNDPSVAATEPSR